MLLTIIRKNKLRTFFLPGKVYGNYWVTDENKQNLINVESSDGKWVLRSNDDIKIINKEMFLDSIFLINYSYCFLKAVNEEEPFFIYCSPTYEENTINLEVRNNSEFSIGSGISNGIVYQNPNVAETHCKISYSNNKWIFNNLSSTFTFINDKQAQNQYLNVGDIIFIMGLRIIIGPNFIILNNPNNKVKFNNQLFSEKIIPQMVENNLTITDDDNLIELYKEEDYFLRSPRFKSKIETEKVEIDSPPQRETTQEMPLIYTIGPMITMGMTSMVTVVSTLTNISNSNKSWSSAIPSLAIAVAMLLSIVLWPTLTKKYNKKQKLKREEKRITKYKSYLETKKKAINDAIIRQRQILIENNISFQECMNIIKAKKRNLWEREIEDEDFLTIRIGIGSVSPDIEIKAPAEHFSLEDDELNLIVQSMVTESKTIENVPINLSLVEKNILAMVGQEKVNKAFIDGVILQLITFHSFDELKIILFTNDENAEKWKYLKILPHCWDDLKSLRFFASNVEEMKQISAYLEKIFYDRKYEDDNQKIRNLDYKNFKPYYIIITDNLKVARNIEIVKKILAEKSNIGFSLIIKNDRLANLPNECPTFLNIDQGGSGLFENELVSTKQKSFIADVDYNLDLEACAKSLANVPLEIRSAEGALPEVVSFLQMYNIGKVEQLNTINRWKTNNPTISLQVPVGIDENGEQFNLDLHEKIHGPHGLIAGMTGSGKSEFIITYILSLAVNFHPNEVTFILIDYKGGGLAGAFVNKDTGVRLPHLAGTITNLDTVEMNRSLASIQSELRRRQQVFNEARDQLNESTIDIYKYQRLYREGLVKTPVSHLFIISDEFAELKAQQPDFMSQLISTARIGRSLGVHLILATQKPAGVVDDQIWSNSKFRVCLKVQDKSDSMDMIKCPDAATIKKTGRFYLQVGYNEFFALGQSAWCGAQYYPTDKIKKKVDNSLSFINSIGQIIKSVDEARKAFTTVSKGEELPNILKYLSNIAKEENIYTRQLWLDRIADVILVDKIKEKYHYLVEKFNINPIIGEYDDPNNQRQDILTLPLTQDGNAIIYGATGSGKELMLSTIIYFLITNHSVEEINIYALDFGAETLRSFFKAPQIGDVLLVNDEEKIGNLLKMLQEKIDERKKLFVEYNGDYSFYCKNSGHTLPTILVIINNYEVFAEAYYDYEDIILQLSREGLKYGVIFILTTNGTNTIRYRLRQNFKLELVLQMNDESDYTAVLGNTDKTYPSKAKGRGIVKLGNVYEFQTAYPHEETNLVEYLKEICNKLAAQYKTRAPRVPILPDKVTLDFVKDFATDLSNIPVGVRKSNLNVEIFDFKSKYCSIITGNEIESFKSFPTALVETINKLRTSKVIIVDTLSMVSKGIIPRLNYYPNSFDSVILEVLTYIEECHKIYVEDNYRRNNLEQKEKITLLIFGISDFYSRLPEEVKKKFQDTIEKGKDLEIVNIIIFDNVANLKKIEYEPWYKTIVTNNRGIWLGNGIADQFTLKLAKTPRELRELIEDGFGYSIQNGIANLVKLIEYQESSVESLEE